MGIEFTGISAEDQQVLRGFIHRKTADRRNHPRVPLATQIYCQEWMSLAFSRDVSLGGMFMDTKQPVPLGSRLSLRFHLDDGGPVVAASAEVRYVVPKLGMGVKFIELTRTDWERIESYVAKSQALADPTRGAAAA